MKRVVAVLAAVCALLVAPMAIAVQGRRLPPATPQQARFFETKIRPLLTARCQSCHGADKQSSGLRLDSRAGILKGGTRGSAVSLASPDGSLLLKAVSYRDAQLRMPPGGKLPKQQIADLKRWVAMGAPWPTVKDAAQQTKDEGDHWAFQSPEKPALPRVRHQKWVQTPVDRFILAALEEKGLKPAPPADRRTLIRRATFDLTGLPPEPDQIDAFLADKSPDAFARVVERLLASQHYGERWGRHWLDVARYADSNGLDENVAYGNAWRYRDYVIDAFNNDKPYDQFVVEQLAGDMLPTENRALRHERLIATGFLALGPKVLAEVDEKKMEMDIVDEQVNTVSQAFMALTMGCARCHDHKFDPITTEDYYALAGIFKSTRTMEHFKKIARWYEHPLASEEDLVRQKAHQKRVADHKASLEASVAQATAALRARLGNGVTLPKNPESQFPEATRARLKEMREQLKELEAKAPELPSALGVTEGDIADTEICVRGSHLSLGERVPRRFPVILAGKNQPAIDDRRSGRLKLARWLVQKGHPLTSRVMVNRIWRWHFGRGIVASTDNFGKLGERPVNQPLLDWLARRFVDDGWSVKAMHRLLMLSSTYQMSSSQNARGVKVDPENRLQWRAGVRRLEAEEIRDALLAVSGLLDREMGGSMLHVKNRAFLFDHTSMDGTKYDSRRRSVYLPVVRNHLYDVFQLFDFVDPAVTTGDRATTTVSSQALFSLNSDLARDAAAALAADLLKQSDLDDAARIRALYLRAYGRPAKKREVNQARELLDRLESAQSGSAETAAAARERAWSWLCHTALAANEFVYLR